MRRFGSAAWMASAAWMPAEVLSISMSIKIMSLLTLFASSTMPAPVDA